MLKEFAADLKKLRENANISLPEISAQTRINESFLKKLEEGDFSFQQEIYIRAFIKEYANAVDLDPVDTLKDYDNAKKGNYKSRFDVEKAEEVDKETKEEIEEEVKKSEEKPVGKPEEKLKDKKEEPVHEDVEEEKLIKNVDNKVHVKKDTTEEKQNEDEVEKVETPKEKRLRISPDKPDDLNIKKHSSVEKPYDIQPKKKTEPALFDSSRDKVQPSVIKGIGMTVLALLILAGLYFTAKALFFEGNGEDEPEVIRQKFDDVVSENERKILGKRSEEEIRDSIRKAEEEARLLAEQNLDTMELKVNSFRSGSIIVVEDSVNINNPEKISFTGNQYGVWKATKYFHITSPNTDAFSIEVNGKKIDIKDKNVKNFLITRQDVQNADTLNNNNQ